jgi:hypothetical protein
MGTLHYYPYKGVAVKTAGYRMGQNNARKLFKALHFRTESIDYPFLFGVS